MAKNKIAKVIVLYRGRVIEFDLDRIKRYDFGF